MKSSTAAILLAIVTLVSHARADLVIVQEVENSATPKQTVTMSFKDGKVRTDVGDGMSTITDTKTGDTVALMHAQKMAMKTTGTASKAAIEAASSMIKDMQPPKKLDKTETINGYQCEAWATEVIGGKTIMWVAKDYPGYAGFKSEMDQLTASQPSPGPKFEPGGMIVRTESEMGGIKSIITVKSVKQDKVDAALFVAPTGYTEMTLPQQ